MSNVDIVKQVYAAFATGDIPTVLGLMADDIVWCEAENYKLGDGNPYVGPQAIVEGVFARLGDDLDDFTVTPGCFIDGGDVVVMEGRYSAVGKANGMRVNPQVVHIWTLKDGKITRFQQYCDTLTMARAVGEI